MDLKEKEEKPYNFEDFKASPEKQNHENTTEEDEKTTNESKKRVSPKQARVISDKSKSEKKGKRNIKSRHLETHNFLEYTYSNTHHKCCLQQTYPFKPFLSSQNFYTKLRPSIIPQNKPQPHHSLKNQDLPLENDPNHPELQDKTLSSPNLYRISYEDPEIHRMDQMLSKLKHMQQENRKSERNLNRIQRICMDGCKKMKQEDKTWDTLNLGINNQFNQNKYYLNDLDVIRHFNYQRDLQQPMQLIRSHYKS
jgi:hypothetical protein